MPRVDIIPAGRLEGVDKCAWTELTSLASENNAVQFGQGFPDFSPPDHVKKSLANVATSSNYLMYQYTRGFGHPKLVQNIAKLFSPMFGVDIDPNKEILITIGALGALYSTFNAFVDTGDEVIIIEPYFDSYQSMVKVAGGTPKFIPLRLPTDSSQGQSSSGAWKLDPDEFQSMFNKKTKAVVINTPNNPLGKVYTREELQMIADLCIKHDCLCIADEVYEWLVYDDHQHIKIGSLPGMWERTITIGSAGKTFSVTGWKLGWAVGPDHLMKHLRTVWQNSIYTCATPLQEAVAQSFEVELNRLGSDESYFKSLPREMQQKRDKMAKILTEAGLKPIIPQGSYFMLVDVSNLKVDLSDSDGSGKPWDYRLVKWLTINKKMATMPATVFYSDEHQKVAEKYLRFCFCKEDSTINRLHGIFKQWAAPL